MPKTVHSYLATERLGNLFELQVRGIDEADKMSWDEMMRGAWRTEPAPLRTVHCTLSCDSAMDLRDEITAWLKAIGAE